MGAMYLGSEAIVVQLYGVAEVSQLLLCVCIHDDDRRQVNVNAVYLSINVYILMKKTKKTKNYKDVTKLNKIHYCIYPNRST